jgi:uncharacterized protein related to proFAR isomerase
MSVPLIYIQGKKAYRKDLGTLRPMGSAIKVAKKFRERLGTELLHIVDLDAMKGNRTNYDIYDHLTFAMYIQVEVRPDPKMVGPLLEMGARVVVALPTKLNLKQYADKKRLLVGKIAPRYRGSLEDVFDVYVDGESNAKVGELIRKKRRVIVNLNENRKAKGVFARIGPPDI